MSTMGIKLEEELRSRLKALAARKERSPHWLMKNAIREYLDREEKFEQERIEDEARWQRYLATGHAIAHAEVDQWLASLGSDKERPCPK